jgi:putative SOS response-associated peptidase YedK
MIENMCGRVRLSSDVSEIKLVFSIPPYRPTPNVAPSWNAAPTDSLPWRVGWCGDKAQRSLLPRLCAPDRDEDIF